MNANLGKQNFGGMEAVTSILDIRSLLYRDLIKNPHLRQYGQTLEELNNKGINQNYGHIIIKLTTGKKINGNQPVRKKLIYLFNYCECRFIRVRKCCKCFTGTLFCTVFLVAHCKYFQI